MSFSQRAIVALMSIALSACANPLGATNAPGANLVTPFAKMVQANAQVEITARRGGLPLAKIEITITHEKWPNGKLITKGVTNRQGRVRLSGDWTNEEWICRRQIYTRSPFRGIQPLPKAIPQNARALLQLKISHGFSGVTA